MKITMTMSKKKEQSIEKVRGRAMLRWDGKKPLERIEYYPAQEKEVYGDKSAKDFNKLFWGDNLQVLSHLLKEHRGKIDLIYIDPPFDSKADYVKKIKVRGKKTDGLQQGLLEEKQYSDIWGKDEYLQFMYERLILMRELLTDKGSIYLHCDWHKSHHLRLILDEVFGESNFINEIAWCYQTRQFSKRHWNRKHDNILVYAKNPEKFVFNWSVKGVIESYKDSTVKKYKHKDEKGYYRLSGRGIVGSPIQSAKDVDPKWEIEHPELVVREYLGNGYAPNDYWLIDIVNQVANERTDFPTQKPEALLEKIIKASSNEGDVVLDCFIGGGTTAATAQKLGRRWIGCDINIGAIQTTTKRLNQIIDAQKSGSTDKDAWLLEKDEIEEVKKSTLSGFKIYNVNEYDVFKNEVEAKDIIMEMYGVERIRSSHFDGVLDNHFVKVMPINRVCTKKDIDDVLKGIKDSIDDFKVKSKSRQNESIYEQGVMVFCSGMELDTLDYLKKQDRHGVDIQMRDILLDKQTLIFKQPPEAQIDVKAGTKKATLTIKDFISPILMRKLDIENEKALKKESRAKVEDCKQIIDSVAIDIDYDGKLFNAEIIDVPAKNELIEGSYELEYEKAGKNTIAIKIVDVLGEEYFETFEVTV